MEHIRKWAGWFRLAILPFVRQALHALLIQVFLAIPIYWRITQAQSDLEKLGNVLWRTLNLFPLGAIVWLIVTIYARVFAWHWPPARAFIRAWLGTLFVQMGFFALWVARLSDLVWTVPRPFVLETADQELWAQTGSTFFTIGWGILLFRVFFPRRER